MEEGVCDGAWIPTKYNTSFAKQYLSVNPTDFYKDIELDNKKFQIFAFATHPEAYLMGGLSTLVKKKHFTDLLLILITPNFIEWKSSETRKQALITSESIFKELIDELRNKMMRIIHSLID